MAKHKASTLGCGLGIVRHGLFRMVRYSYLAAPCYYIWYSCSVRSARSLFCAMGPSCAAGCCTVSKCWVFCAALWVRGRCQRLGYFGVDARMGIMGISLGASSFESVGAPSGLANSRLDRRVWGVFFASIF